MNLALTTQQHAVGALVIKDANGNVVPPTTTPEWQSSDPHANIFTLSVSEDGLTPTVTAVAPGTGTITVTTSGLTATATITVTQALGLPASVEITWGAATETTTVAQAAA